MGHFEIIHIIYKLLPLRDNSRFHSGKDTFVIFLPIPSIYIDIEKRIGIYKDSESLTVIFDI